MSYVYLLQTGESHYKVGVSDDVRNRLRAIQTSNHDHVRIVAMQNILSRSAYDVEREIHQWLRRHRAKGGREWFVLSPDIALELIVRITNADDPHVLRYVKTYSLADEADAMKRRLDILLAQLVKRPDPEVIRVREKMKKEAALAEAEEAPKETKEDEGPDEIYETAKRLILTENRASTSFLQRKLFIGYARASRIMDKLEEEGFVGAGDGAKPRQILAHQ